MCGDNLRGYCLDRLGQAGLDIWAVDPSHFRFYAEGYGSVYINFEDDYIELSNGSKFGNVWEWLQEFFSKHLRIVTGHPSSMLKGLLERSIQQCVKRYTENPCYIFIILYYDDAPITLGIELILDFCKRYGYTMTVTQDTEVSPHSAEIYICKRKWIYER